MPTQLILLALCLLLSAFFSSSETALFSISKIRALHLAKEGTRFDRLIMRMKQDSHGLLTTILIGNNLVNIGGSALATAIVMEQFHSNAVGIATGIMTFLILVFGEIIPKSFATQNNVLVARIVIFPLFWLSKLFYPIIVVLNFIPRILGGYSKQPAVTEDELMTMVEVVEEGGEIKEEERELISNIFEFDDTSSSEIMTPRVDMYVIDVDDPLDIKEIINSGFSRIPVIEENIDNVVGILNIKDLFAHYHERCIKDEDSAFDVRTIMREPLFVPSSKKIDSLLHEFKQLKNHIGIVIDEHGGVEGLVTMEDVLEELVGEISDETDQLDPHLVKLKDKRWIVLGKADIDEINKNLGLSIDESNDYDTFSGYILDRIGRIPDVGESIDIEPYTATVKEKDGNRIKTFVLKKEVKKA
ncbi:MAG: HlyC/CorC family transporter [Desulfobacteraceae bacterium]|nr:HlyC/CorC family transporter [Desulfobacteraceae bacterium]